MAQKDATAGDAADLLLITDATASMNAYLVALSGSLPEIIQMTTLTGAFERIGVLAYRDYCDKDLLEWSGWCDMTRPQDVPPGEAEGQHPRDKRASQADLLTFARSLSADGGGDFPEASKTALAMAHDVMREEATTVTVLYTDAPPHMPGLYGYSPNGEKEAAALAEGAYGVAGAQFAEWPSACRTLGGAAGKRAVVHCVVDGQHAGARRLYALLSAATGGVCLGFQRIRREDISRLTVGLLLAWMGACGEAKDDGAFRLSRLYFKRSDKPAGTIATEAALVERLRSGWALSEKPVAIGDLHTVVTPRQTPIVDLPGRYATDEQYRELVTAQLRTIIESNPTAMAVNPIFGKLWRAASADRGSPARDELVQLFGLRVQKEDPAMKAWLEASYDYAAEIADVIAGVGEGEQFPCVYLDPTQDFASGQAGEDGEEQDRAVNKFTREELLAIGRSCDYHILRRLGKVLTRLSYVKTAGDLPQHVRAAGPSVVPRIPLALTREEHGRKFCRVLLHLVLPGTKLAKRPAALLAALSLRMGIRPLREAADAELLAYKNLWNNIEVPETWNLECLSLLLCADDDFRRRVDAGDSQPGTPGSLLIEEDRRLFKTLVDYKMLELNLQTELTARVGWTPDKTAAPLGPLATCRKCRYPRSVTVMGPRGVCGLCQVGGTCKCTVCTPSGDNEVRLHAHVSKSDTEATTDAWVECRVTRCRAQYVVYNPAALKVPPKCFYCRHGGPGGGKPAPAPAVECRTCRSRMIYPQEYRPAGFDEAAWECTSCISGRETVVDRETTARELVAENGRDWILVVKKDAIASPLDGRSLFHTASNANLAALAANVAVLPELTTALTLSGKPLHNADALRTTLRAWVLARRAQAGECTLCFSPTRKTSLRLACARPGCGQLICEPCRVAWYGLNAPGRLLNTAALGCPFCRRTPAPGAVARFGITRMGGARTAVEEAGEWVYAWCATCGFAKRYAERVCADAVPVNVRNWECEPCVDGARAAALAAEAAGLATQEAELPPHEVERLEALLRRAREAEERAGPRQGPTTCPGCGVMTEKTVGCDHITCPCGVHWCYVCGERSSADGISQHFAERHGVLWEAGWDVDE